ncbi:hypothetical protein SMA90_29450, partial [Escherichia coli]
MAAWGKKALEIMHTHGFSPVDFPGRNASFARYFEKITEPGLDTGSFIPGIRVEQAFEGKESVWCNRNSPDGLEKMQALLKPLLQEIMAHYRSHH